MHMLIYMKYAHELNLNFNQNHFTTIHTTTLTFEVVHMQSKGTTQNEERGSTYRKLHSYIDEP